MSLLRALRAYVGLGPDEDYEGGLMPRRPDHDDGRSLASNDDYWSYGAAQGANQKPRRASAESDQPVRVASRARPDAERERSRVDDQHDMSDGPVIDLRDSAQNDHGDEADDELYIDADDMEPAESASAVIRSLDAVRARPKTVSPASFAEARELADEFKYGVPVVLNLHGVERNLARRLIDFASGVCYCMDGTMEKIGSGVFLLTPDGVEIAEEDRVRILQRGYAR